MKYCLAFPYYYFYYYSNIRFCYYFYAESVSEFMWLAMRSLLKIITGHEPTLVYQWDLCDHVKCQLWQVIMRCTFFVCLLVIKTFYEPHRGVCVLTFMWSWNACLIICCRLSSVLSWNLKCTTFGHQSVDMLIMKSNIWSCIDICVAMHNVWPCVIDAWLWNTLDNVFWTCLCDHIFFNICVIMTCIYLSMTVREVHEITCLYVHKVHDWQLFCDYDISYEMNDNCVTMSTTASIVVHDIWL